jgi:hypothetical protein
MDEILDGKMNEWMDVKGNYWGGGTYHKHGFGLFSKGRDFLLSHSFS